MTATPEAAHAHAQQLADRLRDAEASRDEWKRLAQIATKGYARAAAERGDSQRQIAAVRALLPQISDDWNNMQEETYWDGHLLALAAAVGLDRVPRALDSAQPQDTPCGDTLDGLTCTIAGPHDWHASRGVIWENTTPQDTA